MIIVLMDIDIAPNRSSPPAIPLGESYRDDYPTQAPEEQLIASRKSVDGRRRAAAKQELLRATAKALNKFIEAMPRRKRPLRGKAS